MTVTVKQLADLVRGQVHGDGGLVVFGSAGPGVVPGDTNHVTDVFTRSPLR